ncbi:GntR family transcriptional regulator [Nocardioides lentus]|uniref:GntR family transcriptional regulator n=1 Tax=Nocardioides lentus TaxID=338077 RepID=A0ABN2P1V0_9ACTN
MSLPATTGATTKRDLIVDELRRLILSGELARDARLPQDELAARFSSSITPVREALRALEAEGLVVSAPHRGTRVAGIDVDRVTATYVVRRLVEGHAVARAASRLTRRDLARAEELVAAVEAATEPVDVRAANRDLHFFLYERCGLPGLVEQITGLWASFPWDLALGSPERGAAAHAEHRAILAALREGDAEAARRACEDHIASGFAGILERLTGRSGPDPFDLDSD